MKTADHADFLCSHVYNPTFAAMAAATASARQSAAAAVVRPQAAIASPAPR